MNTFRKQAFSLIETLIVIAILLILVAFISTALKSSLQKAKQTQCLSHLKSLHQAVLLFETDEERRRQTTNPDPDFPTPNQFSQMPGNPAEFKLSILTTYAGSTLDKLKCPATPDGVFGYKINGNLLNNTDYRAKDKNGTLIPFESLKNNNVLIYEVNSGGSRDTRHNGLCYGVTLFGELILNVVDTDVAGAAYDTATAVSQRVPWMSLENKNT